MAGQGSNAGTPSASITQQKQKSVFREYAEALLVALLLALFIRSFIVQAFKIPSGSMLSTLQIGDHILVSKFAYGLRLPYPFDTVLFEWANPERDDVIVFIYPKDETKDFIKRVVAVEGDRVHIRDKQLFVNGEAAENTYARYAGSGRVIPGLRDNYPQPLPDGSVEPITVPPGKLFVMGDNRDHSHDSRFWGFVPETHIVGKPVFIWLSIDSAEKGLKKIRWERMFTTVSGSGQPVSYLLYTVVGVLVIIVVVKVMKNKKRHEKKK